MNNPPVVTTAAGLGEQVAEWHSAGLSVGLVPTMGALHEGHVSLVREAAGRAGRVVVSIFVNPTQFAPHEDFDRYPRTLETDLAKLAGTGAALVYAPAVAEIYPQGPAATIEVGGPSAGLESDVRPHFFAGVATVVAALLRQGTPDVAVFGEKDYQQLLVIKRLVRDLDLPVEIVGAPILREADGLAMSSRNAYLDTRERKVAGVLNRVLTEIVRRARSGHEIPVAEAEGAAELLNAGFDRVDYVAIRDAETLKPIRSLARPSRILAAGYVGKTRLIDNMAM